MLLLLIHLALQLFLLRTGRGKLSMDTSSNNSPKKPLSAYILFCRDERPRIISENANLSFGEVSRHLAAGQCVCCTCMYVCSTADASQHSTILLSDDALGYISWQLSNLYCCYASLLALFSAEGFEVAWPALEEFGFEVKKCIHEACGR